MAFKVENVSFTKAAPLPASPIREIFRPLFPLRLAKLRSSGVFLASAAERQPQSRIEIGHPISYRKRYLILNKELAHFVKQQEHECAKIDTSQPFFHRSKYFVDDSRRYFSEAKEKSRPECIVPSAESDIRE